MPESNDLTMHVPVSGEVLLRINGVEGLHTMGAFEHEVPVTLAVSAGRIGFDWTPKVWEEAISTKGVEPPTPKAAASIVEEVLENHMLPSHGLLASRIVEALEKAGRLK